MSTESGKTTESLGRRLQRTLFFFFGPAQLGRRDEAPPDPDRPVPDPACSLCGRPTSAHPIVRVDGHTHMRCPDVG
jgi:hypothetical protein